MKSSDDAHHSSHGFFDFWGDAPLFVKSAASHNTAIVIIPEDEIIRVGEHQRRYRSLEVKSVAFRIYVEPPPGYPGRDEDISPVDGIDIGEAVSTGVCLQVKRQPICHVGKHSVCGWRAEKNKVAGLEITGLNIRVGNDPGKDHHAV